MIIQESKLQGIASCMWPKRSF